MNVVDKYIKSEEKAIAKKNNLHLFFYFIIAGTALVSIILCAQGSGRSFAICFYGVSFILGLTAFVYLGNKQLKGIRNSGINHVYKGEALVDSQNPYQIQYVDLEGKCRIMECSLLDKIDLKTSTTIYVTLEDERVVEVKQHQTL